MNINYDTLSLMIKYGIIMTGILLLVFLLALATPKLARITDKIMGRLKNPLISENKETGEQLYETRSVYDGNKPRTESEYDNEHDN